MYVKHMVVRSIRRELRSDIVLKSIDESLIEQVHKIKYLGVIIDDKLRMEDHCDYMLKKIGKKINFLNRIGNSISEYATCMVYKSIIASLRVLCYFDGLYERNTVEQATSGAKPGNEGHTTVQKGYESGMHAASSAIHVYKTEVALRVYLYIEQ